MWVNTGYLLWPQLFTPAFPIWVAVSSGPQPVEAGLTLLLFGRGPASGRRCARGPTILIRAAAVTPLPPGLAGVLGGFRFQAVSIYMQEEELLPGDRTCGAALWPAGGTWAGQRLPASLHGSWGHGLV